METGREEIDPFEGIDDPTLRVQMEHEMRAIEELVFVTKLSFVPAHKDKAEGFRATLSCALCRWYDSCGKGAAGLLTGAAKTPAGSSWL